MKHRVLYLRVWRAHTHPKQSETKTMGFLSLCMVKGNVWGAGVVQRLELWTR